MEQMINIRHVSKTYGDVKALDDVTIVVDKGTIHGLIGENGAGKTTLIKALVGIHTVDEGILEVGGQAVYENPATKARIGYVADENQYFKSYKIKQLIGFYQSVYPQFSTEKFHAYNKVMGLGLDKRVRQLSKGMKMRLSIMLNLALNPEVIILDEPTSGLDVIAKKAVLEWIVEEVEERCLTVIIASHHLAELEKLCDGMSIIENGRITYQASVDDIKENVCKLQVVFEEKAPTDLVNWKGVREVTQIGSVYYVVLTDQIEATTKLLERTGTKLIERIPLTLEEAFVYMNGKGE